MEKLITYIGLDVHKNTIVVAAADSGLRKEARWTCFGKVEGSLL